MSFLSEKLSLPDSFWQVNGIYPQVPDSENQGELRTMTQLIQNICEVILSDTFRLLI